LTTYRRLRRREHSTWARHSPPPTSAVRVNAGSATREQAIVAAVLVDLASSDRQERAVPSIRALRRAHAIGQKRVSRIREAITHKAQTEG
jgi:hypothetical protein